MPLAMLWTGGFAVLALVFELLRRKQLARDPTAPKIQVKDFEDPTVTQKAVWVTGGLAIAGLLVILGIIAWRSMMHPALVALLICIVTAGYLDFKRRRIDRMDIQCWNAWAMECVFIALGALSLWMLWL